MKLKILISKDIKIFNFMSLQLTVNSVQCTVYSQMDKDFEFDFEKLKVYQKSLDFIDKIFNVYKGLSQDFKYSLGSNLLRAGLSIANNLAEGSGKKSDREKIRYYGTSLDSTRECVSVFNVLKRQDFIDENGYKQLRLDAKEITSMLIGLINSI